MGLWLDTTKEMARPQSVQGYPELEDQPGSPAPSARRSTPGTGPPRTSRRASPRPGLAQRALAKVPTVSVPRVAAGKTAPGRTAPGKPGADKPGAGRGASGNAAAGDRKGDRASSPRNGRLPMDPRFKERWVSVRREQGHRRLRAAVAAAGAVAVIAGCVGAAFSPLLAVRHVRVSSAAHVPAPEVLAVTGLRNHQPMIKVHAAAEVSRLEALPWVDSALVRRHWPSTVSVTIHERRPIAEVTVTGGAVDVDATGRILTPPHPATAGLPTLLGDPAPGPPGTWLAGTSRRSPPRGGVGASLAVAYALPVPVAARVATVSVDGHGVVTLALVPGPTTVSLGEVAALGERAGAVSSVPVSLARQVAALSTMLSAVDLSKVARVDLTVPDRPALTPTQTPTTLSTTARG